MKKKNNDAGAMPFVGLALPFSSTPLGQSCRGRVFSAPEKVGLEVEVRGEREEMPSVDEKKKTLARSFFFPFPALLFRRTQNQDASPLSRTRTLLHLNH